MNYCVIERAFYKYCKTCVCIKQWFVILILLWLSLSVCIANAIKNYRCYAQEVGERLVAKDKPVVLVVTPPVFISELQPWIKFRQNQGYEVYLLPLKKDGDTTMDIQTEPFVSPEDIRSKIIKIASEREIGAIVLVGDGAPTSYARYGWRDVVPAARVATSVLPVLGGEDVLATDSFYADLDDDGLADVPIGRFPVETPEELKAIITKIIRYEDSSKMGNWVRRINLFAGPNGVDLRIIGSRSENLNNSPNPLGGVSSLVDSVINNMARKMFSEFLPQDFTVTLTQCSLSSVFCPYPPDFNSVFLKKMNEGSLFTVYMGHGHVQGLDRFEENDCDYGVFEIEDCAYLNNPNKSPIALFFACYTGAYDANCLSVGEKLAISPNGPIAVYAASRLTAPYGMCVLGASLLEVAFSSDLSGVEDEPKLLGQVILDAQRLALCSYKEQDDELTEEDSVEIELEPLLDESQMGGEQESKELLQDVDIDIQEEESETPIAALGSHLEKINDRLEKSLKAAEETRRKNSSFRQTLDRAAAIFDPTANHLEEQIREHILEFNLLGDPLLRIKLPQRIEVSAPDIAYSSKEIVISGSIPNLNDKESVVQVELLLDGFRSNIKKPVRSRAFVESIETQKDFRQTYIAANNFVVDAVRTVTQNGCFSTKLIVPTDFSGESVVRIAAFDGSNYYIGSKRLLVRPYMVETTK